MMGTQQQHHVQQVQRGPEEASAAVVDAFYFGVWEAGKCGHLLRDSKGRTYGDSTVPEDFPVRADFCGTLDGGLLGPGRGEQPQGEGVLVSVSGWTILQFWDRSGDKRLGSNSSFILRGTLDLATVLAAAREAFPHIWERYRFEVKLRS